MRDLIDTYEPSIDDRDKQPLDIPRHCKAPDQCRKQDRCTLACWKLDRPVTGEGT